MDDTKGTPSANSDMTMGAAAGKRVFTTKKTNLNILPGELLCPGRINVDLSSHTSYHVHYAANTALTADVFWKPSLEASYGLEKTVVIPFSPTWQTLGGIFSGTTKSRFLSISIRNTDVVPLTDVRVSIFAIGG